tara:strand:- start:790 stop:3138 length:2349 start_codon:yes stop_codon:yes gene_type:complete
VSSSVSGATGSVKVFPLTSLGMKEIPADSGEEDGAPVAQSLETARLEAVEYFTAGTTGPFTGSVLAYMEAVHSASTTGKRDKQVEVLRFEPSFKFTSDTLRKRVIEKVLFPFYRPKYGSACNWAFTNYNTLNFFTGSEVPSDSVLIYPASSSFDVSSTYRPSGSFSFEFYINPRYTSETRRGAYSAGTIFHMSSSYAVSIVTGSSKNVDEFPDGFRLMLQLSHSADIPPSEISLNVANNARPAPQDLTFLSSDNSLKLNTWHYCCVRWGGTEDIQDSTGSFYIDGGEKGTFDLVPTFLQQADWTQKWIGGAHENAGDPDALFVGNFYEGTNSTYGVGGGLIAQFFNDTIATRDGLISAGDFDGEDPNYFTFRHPLNAELHELKIYDAYREDEDIMSASLYGVEDIKTEPNLMFYVPPFFVKDTRTREIFQTPFQTAVGNTNDPFNVALSFGVGGHYLNLENFVKEFVRGSFPRLMALSGSTIDESTNWVSANGFLFATGSVRKRNLTVLPCDNGRLLPNFSLLEQTAPSGSASLSLFVDDLGIRSLSMVSLNNLLSTGSDSFPGLLNSDDPNSISAFLAGSSPDDPSLPAGSILTIFNRTKDPTSNEVVFFDASNLFYGNKIDPGSYVLTDSSITGSGGRVRITLKDNKRGSLYRADCTGSHPVWSSAGTLLYDEGLAIVKTPTIPYFGTDQFDIRMAGQQHIYVLQMNIPAEANSLNRSENPTYKDLNPSDLDADLNSSFVYVTNMNLLDENLNVICKSNFAQTIVKREDDRFMVRVRLDF